MSLISSIQTVSKKAVHTGEDYIEATQDYFKLKLFEQITKSFSLFVKILLIGGLCFIGLILLIVSGILLLAQYLESISLALLYSSLLVFLLSFIIYLVRKPLIESNIIRKISKTFFKKYEDNND